MVKKFLDVMFNGVGAGYINIWTLQDKKSHWYKVTEIDKIADFLNKNTDKDVYFGVGLRNKEFGPMGRGKNEDVSVVTGFWSDIDVKGVAHKQENLPESMSAATEFLESLELQPTIIVDSGNGLHAYWLFDKPIVISTPEHRKNVQDTMHGFQKYINGEAKKLGWVLDTTSDLARVLRLPGSINHKIDDKTMCVVSKDTGIRYSTREFSKYKIATASNAPSSKNTVNRTRPQDKGSDRQDFKQYETGLAEKAISNCLFLQHCRDNADKLPEPMWHAMISNLALAADGVTICHELSSKYPGYKYEETESKVQRAMTERKPHTCRYIKDSLCFDCSECANTCKAPIGLAIITKLEKAQNVLKREFNELTDVYEEEVLDALSYLKQFSMKDYALFKATIKGKFKSINLTEFEKVVSQQYSKQIAAKQSKKEENLVLDGIELGDVRVPDDYIVNMNGIKKIMYLCDSISIVPLCNCPIVISARCLNLDTRTEKVELSFYVDKKWHSFIADRSEVFNKASLLKYSDKGLKVSTSNAGGLVGYLDSYEGENMNNINIKKSINRLGWVGNDAFFPYVTKDIMFETDSNSYVMYENTNSKGTYEKWLDLVQRARENKFARFVLATSVTSTLIEKMGVRNFMLHIWDNSKAGKTAMLKLAISFWGNPERLMGTFNSTAVSLEMQAKTLNNLPLGIDEKQVSNEKKLDFESIVYMLSTGVTKGRGTKFGGVQEKAYWRNIALSTGEEPLLQGNSKDGAVNRCMQVNGRPCDNDTFGKELHQKLTRHYGFGGRIIIEYVCKQLGKNPDYLEELYELQSAKFNEQGIIDSYADYCAAVSVGDYLISTILFNIDSQQAWLEADKLAKEIHENVINGLCSNNTQRGVDFTLGWLVSNQNRFANDATPCYGDIKGDKYLVIPNIVEKAIRDEGFNPNIIIDEMVKQGFITKKANNKADKRQNWVNGRNIRVYEITVPSNEAKPLYTAKV